LKHFYICIVCYLHSYTHQILRTMSKKAHATGNYDDGKHKITCNLDLVIFQEGETVIFYCPALDINGYGLTEEEAEKSFKVNLHEYFKYTTRKNTLGEDLKKYGWVIKKRITKKITPPSWGHLLETNEDLNRIVNTGEYKRADTSVSLPC